MALNPFPAGGRILLARKGDSYQLVVGMTAVKMGDRLIQVGCAHGGRLAAIASKVGLSGRAVLVAPDERSADRGRQGAEKGGVLIETEIAPPTHLPVEDASFDLAVVDDTGGLLGSLASGERNLAIGELLRVVRPGGRTLVIGSGPPRGLAALLGRPRPELSFALSGEALRVLETQGFRSVRTLAERDGLVFVEGIKARA